jgi:hypothetical protein
MSLRTVLVMSLLTVAGLYVAWDWTLTVVVPA